MGVGDCVCVLGVWGGGGGWLGHDYRGCYVIGDSRLNFSRYSNLRLPATLISTRSDTLKNFQTNSVLVFFS